MRAAVLHALGKAPRFEEFPEPTPGEGEVSCVCMRPVGILSLQGPSGRVNGSTGVCAGYDHIIGYLGAFTAVNNEGNAYKSNQARQPNPVRQLIQVIRSPARKNTTSITNIP